MTTKAKKKDAPAANTEAPKAMKNYRGNKKQGHYTTLPGIEQRHYEMLKASAISDEVIKERGYKTITNAKDLRPLGFSSSQERVPGLLLPLHSTDGQTPLYVYRPDSPRVIEDKKQRESDGKYKQKVIKYEMPKGEKMRLDVPPRCRANIGDPSIPLWITEGQKKADALASVGLCSIALLGVWNFIGTNDRGGKVFLSDFLDIAFNNGRPVRIVFDSDVMTKPEVKQALEVLTQRLQRKGAMIQHVYLPGGKNKTGVDDWLAEGHTVEELEDLVEGPRSEIKTALPVIELLDTAPFSIRRPLCLVDGKAYAAAWPFTRSFITQKTIKGQTIQLKEPEEIKDQSLHIVRNDGAIFGPASIRQLSSLGVDVELPDIPTSRDALWSTPGMKKFEQGYRPDPKDVFNRVKSVITRFMDFDRSIADGETMSEMLACFAISTWFLDAFSVAPYIWANGERGSGKTSLLFVLVRLSFLGASFSSSGSFAALRDLADYGATLGIDDAEDITDPKKADPDKRGILLSGNRKGTTVPLKIEKTDGGWGTRLVNCYCPRVFSSIQKPDATLSSRAIIIPVVRTAQRSKGNSDPLDDMQWPCNREKLIDDLWAMSLAYLPEMPTFEKLIGEKSKLIGRDLQPWWSILAVAAWLDSLGIDGLWGKIESLAAGTYQDERIDLEKVDINRIAMFALGEYAARTPVKVEWLFSTQAIVDIMHRIIDDDEIEIEKFYINSRMMGHRFSKMRLGKDLNQRPRMWKISRSELINLFTAYRIPIPDEISKNSDSDLDVNGKNGRNGNNGDIPAIPTIVTINESGQKAEKLPKKPCYTCKSSAWYIGAGGNVLCGVCHPDPKAKTKSRTKI